MNTYRWNVLLCVLLRILETLLWIVHISFALGVEPSDSRFTCDSSRNDICALLQFREKLLHRGQPALASWSSSDVRLWKGITWQQEPDGEYHAVRLELAGFQLKVGDGSHDIDPLLADGLTRLEVLNLSGNLFNVMLPRTLRVCPALQVLDLSNSSFYGSLPHHMDCEDYEQQSDMLKLVAHQKLRVFNLSHNNFTGEVSDSLFSYGSSNNAVVLGNLSFVDLATNYLTGRIPYSLANSTSLTELNLSSNSFTGPISGPLQELGKLPHLQILDLTDNNLSGRLPPVTEAGAFRSLKYLVLGHNALTGSIPKDLGNLSSLEVLDLADNLLTGVVPKELGNLSRLNVLHLAFNELVGAIPEDLGKLSHLENLGLSQNNLTGKIPDALSTLTNLRVLELAFNRLNGTIASDLSHLGSLQKLSLSHNEIYGPAPWLAPVLSNCTNLRTLWLSQNHITGSIPPDIGNATKLVVFSMFGNVMQGRIPSELGQMNAKLFDVSFNQLSGAIPSELCTLTQLEFLILNTNSLTGTIPNCLGNLSSVRNIDLSVNLLSGDLPSDLGNLSLFGNHRDIAPELAGSNYIVDNLRLVYPVLNSPVVVSFANNLLTGALPASLGKLIDVQILWLQNNAFSGEIPPALGNMSALFLLDLSYNSLQGRIPDELTRLTFLSRLNLSYNDLEGPIPDTNQFVTFSSTSFVGNARLCGKAVKTPCLENSVPPTTATEAASTSNRWEATVSTAAVGVGFVSGFAATWAALIFSATGRRYLVKSPKVNRDYNRRYGLFAGYLNDLARQSKRRTISNLLLSTLERN